MGKIELSNNVRVNNRFALELFSHEAGAQSGNVLLAPYSISAAMALVFSGAAGETQSQISNVLGFTGTRDDVSRAFAKLRGLLGTEEVIQEYSLNIASGLWVDQSLSLLDDFENHSKKFYQALPNRVDFQNYQDRARETINRWVETQTHAKIRNFIQEGTLSSLTRLLLITATYFKGNWAKPFEKSGTQDSPFWLRVNQSINVSSMSHEDQFSYAETATFQVLELPYAGDRLSMIFFLPKEINGLPELEARVTSSGLETWTDLLRPTQVKVYLPKFKMSSRIDLGQTLAKMGMPIPFERQADFSRMSDSEDLHLEAILHQTFIEVSEVGAEAAGSTGVVLGGRSLRGPQPVVFRADHPFLFVIREAQSGVILFLGRFVDPKFAKSTS